MISFVYFTKTNPLFALVLLVLAFLLDGLDGSLARLQNVATDKGKFIDILADNLNFTLFVMGLTYAELIPGLLAAALIYSMVISRALQIILKGLTMPSDWYFKPWAGAYVNTFVYLSYLLFFLFVVFKIDIFERTLWIFTGLLALKALIDFYLIIKKPSQKKSN
jgi:phosphatidylglycerophosphate synthase